MWRVRIFLLCFAALYAVMMFSGVIWRAAVREHDGMVWCVVCCVLCAMLCVVLCVALHLLVLYGLVWSGV